jgi:hypothetical protein
VSSNLAGDATLRQGFGRRATLKPWRRVSTEASAKVDRMGK